MLIHISDPKINTSLFQFYLTKKRKHHTFVLNMRIGKYDLYDLFCFIIRLKENKRKKVLNSFRTETGFKTEISNRQVSQITGN